MYYNIYTNIKTNTEYNIKDIKKEEDSKMVENDTLIEKCAIDISDFADIEEAFKYFSNLSKENSLCKQISPTSFQYKDYFIDLGAKFVLTPHAIGLEKVQGYNLSCAPKLIAYSDTKNNKSCTLITKIPGCSNSNPTPYKNVSSQVSIGAKRNFLNDLKTLAQNNIVNISTEDINNWYTTPETGCIIISNWSDFASFRDEKAKNIYLKRMSENLGLIY